MPRNNRRDAKRIQAAVVGEHPPVQKTPDAANIIVRKNLQDALIEGLEKPSQWCKDFLDIDPYEAQGEYLDESRDCSEDNFVAGNRVGKTWVSGARLLWKAFYRHTSPYTEPEMVTPHNVYKAVAVSMTIDQAKLSWTYAHTFATNSPRFRRFYREALYSPFPTIYLQTPDGKGGWTPSEVWARSLAKGGLYLLGHSINYILVDECAYIKNYPHIEDEVVRMRLADTGGSISRISTPNGRNFFYTYFLQGTPDRDGNRDPRFYSKRVTTHDNPYVSKEFLAQQRERMMPEFYAQNIMAEFVSLSDFFKLEYIQELYTDVEYSLNVEPRRGATYVMGVDLGAQRDPTVVYVLDVSQEPAEMVYAAEIRNSSWRAVRGAVAAVYGIYKPATTFVDSTGVGAPIAQALMEEDGLDGVTPFVFTASSKPDLLTRLQDAVQSKKFVFPYGHQTKELINQLSFYRLDDKAIAQDCVMAIALTWAAAEKLKKGIAVDTVLYDDLLVIPVRGGGAAVPGDLVLGRGEDYSGGVRFQVDPATGLFFPIGGGGVLDLWGF